MNKKILTGLSVFALVAGFWACGDGSVEALNDDDLTVKGFLDDSELDEKDSTLSGSSFFKPEDVEAAKTACLEDEGCKKAMDKATGEEVVPESEASIPTAYSSATQTNPGSSQSGPVINLSSAQITPVGGSSSSTAGGNQTTTSSSSEEIVSNGDPDGSCSLSPTGALQKGEKATWTFTKAQWSGDMIADYEGYKAYNSSFETIDCVWTLTGSDEKTTTVKCSETSVTATYPSIGSYTAKIKVGNKEPHDCSGKVEVQGTPVTGCECTVDEANPDVKNGDVTVTWTVSGCMAGSVAADIGTYTWTGPTATSDPSKATATVSTKGDSQTASVKVTSTENASMNVTCPTVKAINSDLPDYELVQGETLEVPVGQCGVASVAGVVRFEHPYEASDCDIALTIDGTEYTKTVSYCNVYYGVLPCDGVNVSAGTQICVNEVTSSYGKLKMKYN